MELSIIVPTYKSEKTVLRCLESIKAQSFLDFECIIVDFPETKNTQNIVNSFIKSDSRFRYFESPKKGAMPQRVYGISQSKGLYIGFVDSDDVVPPDYFNVLVRSAKDNHVDYVCTQLKRINEEEIKRTLSKHKPVNKLDGYIVDNHYKKIIKNYRNTISSISLCNKLFKRELFDGSALYYNDENTIKYYEDAIIIHYISLKANNVFISNQALYLAVSSSKSVTNNCIYDVNYLNDCMKVSNILLNIYSNLGYKKYRKQASIYSLFGVINFLLLNFNSSYKQFKVCFSKCRKKLLQSINRVDLLAFHKEFSFSEKLIALFVKINSSLFSFYVIKRLKGTIK